MRGWENREDSAEKAPCLTLSGLPILLSVPPRLLPSRIPYPQIHHMTHRYITVSYNLYADNDAGIHELLEQAPEQYPFQFITNMGMALDAFESRIANLSENEEFDFTLSVEEGYGPYDPAYIIEVPKSSFFVNGKFAEDVVYPGSVIPLVNDEGMRFHGLVTDIKENTVVVDVNERYAGKALHFKGRVITAREASDEEIKEAINALTGGGCGGGCSGWHGGGCCHGEDEGAQCECQGNGHDKGGCCKKN